MGTRNRITTEYQGAVLPQFVPCLGGRCPEQMQLEGQREFDATGDDRKLVYRCMRKPGYTSPRSGELYTGACCYHENAYPAADYSYWHRSQEKSKRPKYDPNSTEAWDTAI